MVGKTVGCVGINVPVAASYPSRDVAGHKLIDLPGGMFVMGSSRWDDATPRWVYLDPYSIGQTAVREDQYQIAESRAGFRKKSLDRPATMVSYNDVHEYLAAKGSGLRLLTEAEWESAARGPAVNMQEAMKEEIGKFTPADFVDFAEGRFENFVFSALGQIFTKPTKDQLFRKLIERGMPFYGWRVYGTPSGRLNHDEAWYDQSGAVPVEWGPANAYGLKGMVGGVREWVQNWYMAKASVSDLWNPTGPDKGDHRVLRGGSWYYVDAAFLRAAYRNRGRSGGRDIDAGFRVAAIQDS